MTEGLLRADSEDLHEVSDPGALYAEIRVPLAHTIWWELLRLGVIAIHYRPDPFDGDRWFPVVDDAEWDGAEIREALRCGFDQGFFASSSRVNPDWVWESELQMDLEEHRSEHDDQIEPFETGGKYSPSTGRRKAPGAVGDRMTVVAIHYALEQGDLITLKDEGKLKSLIERCWWHNANCVYGEVTPLDVRSEFADLTYQQLPVARREFLGSLLLSQQGSGEDVSCLKAMVAMHPSTPPSVLSQLIQDVDPSVRAAVARNRESPIDLLRILSVDPDITVRTAVFVNQASPEEVRAQASLAGVET